MHRKSLFASEPDDSIPSRKRIENREPDIIPIVIVVFLVLFFFMAASKMQALDDSHAASQKTTARIKDHHATIILIKTDLELPGQIPVIFANNNRPLDLDGLKLLVADRVRSDRNQVIIEADRHVPFGFTQQVARAVAEVEGAQIAFGVSQ